MSQRHCSAGVIAGIAMLVLGTSSAVSGQDEGVKQVQQLIKRANGVVESITDAKAQVQKTMEAYNSVLAPDAKDRRDAYKKLQKEMATADKKRAEVSSKAGEMNAEADKLFQSWNGSMASISNPNLRKRSEERLKTTQERFADIRQAGQSAANLYTPFMKSLQDQVAYLGHDLNPSAVASLKPDAEKLKAQATELYSAIDKVTAAANTSITKLSTE